MKETVKKVARTARLLLTEEEIEKFSNDLETILDAFDNISKVNTGNVKPSFQPTEIKNVLRKDVVKKGLTQEEALSNTKNKEDGYFKGPKSI